MRWYPIEKAPKDGTRILGWADGDYAVVRWAGDYNDYWSLCVTGAWAEDSEWTPEFWQPLPPEPRK